MENKYVCSVDIGGTKIATAIMEYPADGSVPHPVFEAEVPTEAQEGGEAVFQRIEASIKAALEANPDVEVLGVGIGAAGVVDPKTGAIAYANEIMPGWSGVQTLVFPLPLWATCRLMLWARPTGASVRASSPSCVWASARASAAHMSRTAA